MQFRDITKVHAEYFLRFQTERAFAVDVCDSTTSRIETSSIHNRHIPKQAVPVNVHRLQAEVDVAQVEQVSRSQAQVEGQDQVRQIAVIYNGIRIMNA